MSRIRVVQWTTGKTGSAAVRAMAQHPGLELVGCYGYSPAKIGRDVGEICGVASLGIPITNDIESLLSLHPDCVIYTPYRPDFDQVVHILESGVNVVTSMYMLGGVGYGDLVSHRVKDAAVRGNASLYASGIYPGHAPMVALAVSAMCERIEQISVLESLEISGYANEKMFRAQGFDLEMEDPEALARAEASCGSFRDQVSVMARALGVQLDELRFAAQFASADSTTDFGFMTVRQGRIAGIRGAVVGMLRDRSVIECRFVWKLGSAMTPNWPIVDGYLIEIEGSPQVRCRIEPLSAPFDGAVTTVMPLLNAIPATCAAAAGIVNQMDLPFVRGYRTVR